MSKFITGSICLTDLNEKAKAGHSAFGKGKNGKWYFNFAEWINDEPDQYGNHCSLLLNSKKEAAEQEGKIYIGNGKVHGQPQAPQVNQNTGAPDEFDDLPF